MIVVSEMRDLFLSYATLFFSHYFSDFMYSWIPDLLRHWCMNCQKPRLNTKIPIFEIVLALCCILGKYAFMYFKSIIYLKM